MKSGTRSGERGLLICVVLYFVCPALACASLVWVILGRASWSLGMTVATIDFVGFVFLTTLARWRGKQLTQR